MLSWRPAQNISAFIAFGLAFASVGSAVPETPTNYILNMIAVICGLGVVIAVCVATSGLDTSVGFF